MNTESLRILVIEDEAQVRRFLRASLSSHGYELVEAFTGRDGLDAAAREKPGLILLDLGLPDLDGVEVTRRIREWTATPILVLSARGQERDKVEALDAGADDYLTKPFSMNELLARIRVARRHADRGEHPSGPTEFKVGELRADLLRRQVFRGDKEVHLTPIEYKLLCTLIQHAGRVMTQEQLLREVWGPGRARQTQYLHVYMGHLRAKLEPEPARPRWLLTEPGVGYRLKEEE